MKGLILALCFGAALAIPVPDADWSPEQFDFDDDHYKYRKSDDDNYRSIYTKSDDDHYRFNYPKSYWSVRRYNRDVDMDEVQRVERDADPQLLLDTYNTVPFVGSPNMLPLRTVNTIYPAVGQTGYYNRMYRSADPDALKSDLPAVLRSTEDLKKHPEEQKNKEEEKKQGKASSGKPKEEVLIKRNKREADPTNPQQKSQQNPEKLHQQHDATHIKPGQKKVEETKIRQMRDADPTEPKLKQQKSEQQKPMNIRKQRDTDGSKPEKPSKPQKPELPKPLTEKLSKKVQRDAVAPFGHGTAGVQQGTAGMRSGMTHQQPGMTQQHQPGMRTGMTHQTGMQQTGRVVRDADYKVLVYPYFMERDDLEEFFDD